MRQIGVVILQKILQIYWFSVAHRTNVQHKKVSRSLTRALVSDLHVETAYCKLSSPLTEFMSIQGIAGSILLYYFCLPRRLQPFSLP